MSNFMIRTCWPQGREEQAKHTYGCESKPHFVAAHPPPPTPYYIPLCRGLLLHTFVANDWCKYALQKNLVAKVIVASQEILLQTYVVEWSPKPLTNPMFLIHSPMWAGRLNVLCCKWLYPHYPVHLIFHFSIRFSIIVTESP